jgi:polar amino acid transport system substrate-binding protein
MRARRLVAIAAGLLALSVFATACDDGGSSNDQATAGPTPATTATTAPPAAPDCGNPVQSFAPLNPMPEPLDMPSGTYMAEIQQRGRLIAGVSADTLLFGYFNPLTSQLEGFDIDLVNQVAQAIFGTAVGHVEYKVMTYAQRIPALLDGSVDLVADVMTVNCDRWAQISFSSQYFDAGQKILVGKDSPVTDISQLNGKKMCAARGSTNIEELKKYPEVIVVPVDDVSDCMVLFQQGTVDSVTADDTVLAGFVAQDPFTKIVGPPLTSEPYGLGVAKTHPEFVRFVNGVLDDVRDSGQWADMYRKWLQPTGPAPAPPAAVYGRNP